MTASTFNNENSNVAVQGSVYGGAIHQYNHSKVYQPEVKKGFDKGFINTSTGTPYIRRTQLLNHLASCLCPEDSTESDTVHQTVIFVLHGLGGGSGKTQLAIGFGVENRDKFKGVFLVDASTPETLRGGFAAIASEYHKTTTTNPDINAAKLGKTALMNSQDWLLILDNAESDAKIIKDWIPGGQRGSVIITTRNPLVWLPHATDGMYQDVAEMDIGDSVELLLGVSKLPRTKDNLDEARRLAEELGCYPLALVQAGGALGNKLINGGKAGSTIKLYLKEFVSQRESLRKNGVMNSRVPGMVDVYTTWVISRKTIESMQCPEGLPRASKDALELLDLSSQLYSQDIPLDIFAGLPSYHQYQPTFTSYLRSTFLSRTLFGEYKRTSWSTSRIQDACNLLASYSLVNYNGDKNSFSMHRLVHGWAARELATDWRLARFSIMIALANSIDRSKRNLKECEFRRRIAPHLDYLKDALNSNQIFKVASVDKAEVAFKYAVVYLECGHYFVAEDLLREAWKSSMSLSQRHDRKALSAGHDWAVVLAKLGRYPESRDTSRIVLVERQKCLGEDDPDTLDTLGTLALALQRLGNLEESKEMYASILASRTKILGQDSPATLETMSSLSSVFREMGLYDKAVETGKDVWLQRRRISGEHHPDTLESLSSLALSLEYQGVDLRESERICRLAMEQRKKALGEFHPDTLDSMAHLASFFLHKGNYSEADEIYKEVYEKRIKVLGAEHHHTLMGLSDWGEVFQRRKDEGDETRTKDMLLEARDGLRKQLPLNHPDLLVLQANLAVILRSLGDLERSEEIYKVVLKGYDENGTQDHPEALRCMANLATLLRKQNRFDEAETYGHKVLEVHRRMNGLLVKDAFVSMVSLARTKLKKENYLDARKYLLAAMEGFKGVYGSDNLAFLDTVALFAHTEHKCQNWSAAEQRYIEAMTGLVHLEHLQHWCFTRFETFQRDVAKNENGLKELPKSLSTD